MIDWLARKVAAWFWQRKLRLGTYHDAETIAEWKRFNPGRCMYCGYTRWANVEMGQNLKLDPHACIEGHSPPEALPTATVVRRR